MTATHVNGLEVITDEPAEAPLSTADRPVFFKQIRRLLLADGDEVFGCVHCTYTADSVHRVRPHLGKHSRRGTDPRPGAVPTMRPQADVAELLARLAKGDTARAELSTAQRERNRWKRRALDAERDLETIRRAIRGHA